MPMWATCRTRAPSSKFSRMRHDGFNTALGHGPRAFSRPGRSAAIAAGFTLLEMIVVLAILGLATALVGPSAIRGIDSWRRQAELDSLLDQIRALPGDARANGKSITISDQTLKDPAAPPLRVGNDWTLSVPTVWVVNPNGVCQGGDVFLATDYGSRTIAVAGPFCEPVIGP